MPTYDAVVIGAGVFGAWTANHLAHNGAKVLLLDSWGPANARASSGGESRLIRMGYGTDEIYTAMAQRSLVAWRTFFERTGKPLFHRTGLLWLARNNDPRIAATEQALTRTGVPFEKLSQSELGRRYPQVCFDAIDWGLLEPESGALLARRAVQAVVDDAIEAGVEFRIAHAPFPCDISAGNYIYACGPWLPKIFPAILGNRIFPTRQEIFFFGTPAGDASYTYPTLPAWIEPGDLYGFPDLESRGFKVASDHHGPPIDPDQTDRIISPQSVESMRTRVAAMFPGLANAPLVESRVCQYENTSNGDFLIDRHPDHNNIWFVGGGSGHGFKHGPAVGEYTAARLAGTIAPEPRFSLDSKQNVQRRSIY